MTIAPLKHIIGIDDISRELLFGSLLEGCTACIPRAHEFPTTQMLDRKVTLLFLEPSTRTQGSYSEAARRLGWSQYLISGAGGTALKKKESIANTARMMKEYGTNVLVVRSEIEGAARFIAEILDEEESAVAVHNAGDGANQHPTQTILDLLTLSQEFGRLEDFVLGIFGDAYYGRTAHSLLRALRNRGISLVLVSSKETALQEQYREGFTILAEGDDMSLLSACDVGYGLRLQEERYAGDTVRINRARGKFRVTKEILSGWNPRVKIMHPLPYVDEISPEVLRDPRIIIRTQAWYGIPTRMHLLERSFENLNKQEAVLQGGSWEINVLREPISLQTYLEQQRGKKGARNHQHFSPIEDGLVIDHIPQGLVVAMRDLLLRLDVHPDGVRQMLENVPSKRYSRKDILVLERTTLREEVMACIAMIAPDATFNIIQGGIFTKIKMKARGVFKGIGKCPNIVCITNVDPEAHTRFVASSDGQILSCYYCERAFARNEVIQGGN